MITVTQIYTSRFGRGLNIDNQYALKNVKENCTRIVPQWNDFNGSCEVRRSCEIGIDRSLNLREWKDAAIKLEFQYVYNSFRVLTNVTPHTGWTRRSGYGISEPEKRVFCVGMNFNS